MNKKMEIYADIRQKVIVNPVDVLNKLIKNEIGDGWVFEKDGKYFLGYFESAGSHSYESSNEITKDTFDYINSLKIAIKYLGR